MRGRDTLRRFGADSPAGPLDLGVPDQSDMRDLVALVRQSFDRLFAKKRLSEGQFGVFAAPWNAWRYLDDEKEIEETLQFRLGLGMQFPSLRRPVNQDIAVGVIARERQRGGRGPLAAFFQLCLLPADGRRPADNNVPPKGSAPPLPYLSNLCVAEPYRRRGLGRSMLQLAEDVVVNAWGDDTLYLHIDEYVPSQRLYPGAGYAPVAAPFEDGVLHMSRLLWVPGAEQEEEADALHSADVPGEEAAEVGEPPALGDLGPSAADSTTDAVAAAFED